MKAYQVIHRYSFNDGFDDTKTMSSVVFTTTNREAAENWVKKWSHPVVYAIPYDALDCFFYYINVIDILDDVDVNDDPCKFGEEMWFNKDKNLIPKEIVDRLYNLYRNENGEYIGKSLDHSVLLELEQWQKEHSSYISWADSESDECSCVDCED